MKGQQQSDDDQDADEFLLQEYEHFLCESLSDILPNCGFKISFAAFGTRDPYGISENTGKVLP